MNSRHDTYCTPDNNTVAATSLDELMCDAFEQAGVALALVSLDGKFIHANRAACALLGLENSELVSHPFNAIATFGENNSPLDLRKLCNTGRPTHLRLQHQSQGTLDVIVTASMVRDATQSAHIVLHIEDVTERRRCESLEHDRRQILEMTAKDQPLPGILHQLISLIERQIPGIRTCLMLLYDGSMRLFGPSLPKPLTDAMNRRPIFLAARLSSSAPALGAPPRVVSIEDHPACEVIRAEAHEAGIKSCWTTTVSGGDSVPLGILLIFCSEDRRPTAAEQRVIDVATHLAIIGIEHHLTTRQLAYLVRHDALTGLPNRILFEDRLTHALQSARRSGRPLALLAMDLNRFKHVNDTLGHHAGDAMLQQFALRVRSHLRECDTLARVGGDEFMLIIPDISGRDEAEVVARRIREALASFPFNLCGHPHIASTSIGIALFPTDGDDSLMLQRAADVAMYRAKEQGRREVV